MSLALIFTGDSKFLADFSFIDGVSFWTRSVLDTGEGEIIFEAVGRTAFYPLRVRFYHTVTTFVALLTGLLIGFCAIRLAWALVTIPSHFEVDVAAFVMVIHKGFCLS